MSDILDDKAYIEEQRHRISDLKAMLQEQYQKTSTLEQQLAQAREDSKSFQATILHMEAIMVDQAQQNAAMRALLEALFDESGGIFYEIPEPLWKRWCFWMVANEPAGDSRRKQAHEWLEQYYPDELRAFLAQP